MIIRVLVTWVLIAAISIFGSLILFVGYQSWKTPPRSEQVPQSTFQSDLLRGYIHKPGLDLVYPFGVGQQFILMTNSRGARTRNPAVSIVRPSIVVVGDSQTFGYGINYDKTYSALLEAQLGAEVLNLGVSGYGTVSSMLMAREFLSLKPKVIVLGYYYDHIVRNVSPCYPGFMLQCLSVPHVVDMDGGNPAIVSPSDNTFVLKTQQAYYDYISGQGKPFSFLKDFSWTGKHLWADFFQSSPWMFGRRNPGIAEQARVTEFLLSTFKDMVDQHQTRLIILYIPDYFRERVVAPPDYLQHLAEEFQLGFVDMTSIFQESKDKGRSIQIPNDGHLNELGHQLIAQTLIPYLEESFTASGLLH